LELDRILSERGWHIGPPQVEEGEPGTVYGVTRTTGQIKSSKGTLFSTSYDRNLNSDMRIDGQTGDVERKECLLKIVRDGAINNLGSTNDDVFFACDDGSANPIETTIYFTGNPRAFSGCNSKYIEFIEAMAKSESVQEFLRKICTHFIPER